MGVGSSLLVSRRFVDAFRNHPNGRVVEPEEVPNLFQRVLVAADRPVDPFVSLALVFDSGEQRGQAWTARKALPARDLLPGRLPASSGLNCSMNSLLPRRIPCRSSSHTSRPDPP